MVPVWYKGRSRVAASMWILGGVILGFGGELGQLLGWVPGTFDVIDLLFYIVGFLLAVACAGAILRQLDRHKNHAGPHGNAIYAPR
jgi:hypothetical protein